MNRFATSTALAAMTLAAGSAFAGTQSERVQANATEYFTWEANATGELIVNIDGDGDTDLDLYVFDEDGNQLGSDLSFDDNEQVRIRVREGREYEIQVRNLGDVFNDFDLELAYSDESWSGRVNANSSVTIDYRAPRGETTVTAILHGDGDTDVDIRIYDSRGNLVVQGLSFDDHEFLVFEAIPGEEYEVELSNLGDVYNMCQLDFEEAD